MKSKDLIGWIGAAVVLLIGYSAYKAGAFRGVKTAVEDVMLEAGMDVPTSGTWPAPIGPALPPDYVPPIVDVELIPSRDLAFVGDLIPAPTMDDGLDGTVSPLAARLIRMGVKSPPPWWKPV